MPNELSDLNVLIIDDISAMRQSIKLQLMQMDIHNVSLAAHADEAIRQIGLRRYDIVLCDYNLNASSNGQHLLEFLRAQELLAHDTLFLMVTAEAEYGSVASVAEFQPDDYLLKPFAASKIKARLERLLKKREAMLPLMEQFAAKNFPAAIRECDKLINDKSKWTLEALRHKGASLLQLNDPQESMKVYESALLFRDDLPWARLGQAKCHLEMDRPKEALEIAESLLAKNKTYVLVYDLLAAIAEKNDDPALALTHLKECAKVLPSTRRSRMVAEAAYHCNDLATARSTFEEIIRKTRGSMTEQSTDYLVLAQAHVDADEPKKAFEVLDAGTRSFGDKGEFAAVQASVKAQAHLKQGDAQAAKKMLQRAANLVTEPKADLATAAMAKAYLAAGDEIAGMRLCTLVIQSDAKNRSMHKFVEKSLADTGHGEKVDAVVYGGRKKILKLVAEANSLMRKAKFAESFQKLMEAFAIQRENIEVLLAATQLHLLWINREGVDALLVERARGYLSTLDRILPGNERVMHFYRFFNETLSEAGAG